MTEQTCGNCDHLAHRPAWPGSTLHLCWYWDELRHRDQLDCEHWKERTDENQTEF